MGERRSALAGHARPRPSATETDAAAVDNGSAVRLYEIPAQQLWQIAAWPDTLAEVGRAAATAAGLPDAPGPGRAGQRDARAGRALLRRAPLQWWLGGDDVTPPALEPADGVVLDLSHAFSQVGVAGPDATTVLNRHLPLDLREHAFPIGAVASSAFHHVGVTLWRDADGYRLFIPRGFALSLWQLLRASAAALDS